MATRPFSRHTTSNAPSMTIKVNLESKGYRLILDALVVGLLGSWDPLNADVFAALNISVKRWASVAKRSMQTAIMHHIASGSAGAWLSRSPCRVPEHSGNLFSSFPLFIVNKITFVVNVNCMATTPLPFGIFFLSDHLEIRKRRLNFDLVFI